MVNPSCSTHHGQPGMINRRELLRMGLGASASLLAGPRQLLAQATASQSAMKMPAAHAQGFPAQVPAAQQSLPVTLASYVTPLSIPPAIRPPAGAAPLRVHMRQFRHKAHRDLPPSTMWGYNGMWPGPTFEVRKG